MLCLVRTPVFCFASHPDDRGNRSRKEQPSVRCPFARSQRLFAHSSSFISFIPAFEQASILKRYRANPVALAILRRKSQTVLMEKKIVGHDMELKRLRRILRYVFLPPVSSLV